jgi:hypothetical protein
MTTEPCREWRGEVAALALGGLDAAEAARARAHVDGCLDCRAALDELQRTARALPLGDPAHVLVAAAPPSDLAERILREVRHEQAVHRRRVRRRVAAALTSVAAAAAAVVLVVTVALDGGGSMQDFAIEPPGVEASYALHANAQGTAVELEHRGLDPGEVYWLWLTDAGGTRVSAGTFLGSSDRSSITLQSALPADQAVRIWVTEADDQVVLDAPLR